MDQRRFAILTRALTGVPSRRDVVRGVASLGLGLGIARVLDDAEAKKKRGKKRKRKPKKPKPNVYGCLNVGQRCRGDSSRCCSGICQGKKPKKGKKDRSRCVGHDASICRVDYDLCSTGGAHVCSPTLCACLLTTGKAPFCGDPQSAPIDVCVDCTHDTDCEADFGPGAACVVFGGICSENCPNTGTACMPACKNAVPKR